MPHSRALAPKRRLSRAIEPQLANAEKEFAEQAAVSLGRRKIGLRKVDSYYGVVFLGAVEG